MCVLCVCAFVFVLYIVFVSSLCYVVDRSSNVLHPRVKSTVVESTVFEYRV